MAEEEVSYPDEFPRWKHRPGESRLFDSQEEFDADDGDWSDKPIDPLEEFKADKRPSKAKSKADDK